MKKLKTRDMMWKSKPLNGIEHLVTYTEYIDKADGIIIAKTNAESLANIANLYNKLEDDKLQRSKGGRKGLIAKNFVLSFPEQVAHLINGNDEKQINEIAKHFLDIFYEAVSKQHPKAKIKWLREHTSIIFHNDSDNHHFHIVAPTFTPKGLMSNDFEKIDYAKFGISAKMRREQYKYCHNLLSKELVTDEDIRQMAKAEKKTTKNKNWSKRIEQIKSSTKDLDLKKQRLNDFEKMVNSLKNDLEAQRADFDAKEAEYSQEMRKELSILFNTMNKQLENGNTDRAVKTSQKITSLTGMSN